MAYVKNRSGDIVEVSDDVAKNAGVFGYTPATAEDIAAEQARVAKKAEFSTLPQQTLGAGEALLRGASVGLYDPLAVALGADAERMAARREEIGGLGTALEVGGAVAPIVLSGGTATPGVVAGEVAGRTALQSAARLAPTSIISRLSEAAGERAATALLGETAAGVAPTLGRTLARGAIQGGVSELVEGVPYSAGQVVTEATLGDLDLLSEEAAMTVGLGTILGGGLGAAFGAAGGGLGHALRKSQSSLDRATKWFEDKYPEWIAGSVDADPEDIRYAMANADRLTPTTAIDDIIAERRPVPVEPAPFTPGEVPEGAVFKPGTAPSPTPETPQPPRYEPAPTVRVGGIDIPNPALSERQQVAFARDMTSALEDARVSMEDVTSEFNAAFRPQERAKLLDGVVAPERAQEEAIRVVRDLNATIAKASENGPDRFNASALSQMIETRDGILRNIVGPDDLNGIATVPSVSQIYDAIDTAKNQLQAARKQVSFATPQGPDTRKVVGDLNARLKKSLESEDVWGAAGARQASINRAYSELIDAEANAYPLIASKPFVKGTKRPEIDGAKVSKLLSGVGTFEGEGKLKRVYDLLDKQRAFRDELQKTADTVGAQFDRAAIDAAEDRARQLVSMEEEARKIRGEEIGKRKSAAKERSAWKEADAARKDADAAKLKEFKTTERIRKLEAKQKMEEFTASEAEKKATAKALKDEYAQQVKDRDASIREAGKALRAGARWNGFMDIIGAGAVGQNPLLAPVFVAYRFGKYLGSPDKTIRVLSQLKRESAKAKAAIDTLAEQFTRGHRVGAVRSASSMALSEEAIDSIVRDPESAIDTLSESTAELRDFAPETAQRVEGTLINAAQYLASIRPKPSIGPMGSTIPPSAASVAQYESTKAVVEHPLDAFMLASQGRLLPRHIEALSAVWPKMLSQLRVATLDGLVTVRTEGKVPSFRVLQQASVIFQQDLTQTVSGGAANQAMMQAEAKQATPTPARADKITTAQRSQTPWEASESN